MTDLVKRMAEALREAKEAITMPEDTMSDSTFIADVLDRIDALLAEFDPSLAEPSPAQASAKPEGVECTTCGALVVGVASPLYSAPAVAAMIRQALIEYDLHIRPASSYSASGSVEAWIRRLAEKG